MLVCRQLVRRFTVLIALTAGTAGAVLACGTSGSSGPDASMDAGSDSTTEAGPLDSGADTATAADATTDAANAHPRAVGALLS
jgi:hypothetical protein